MAEADSTLFEGVYDSYLYAASEPNPAKRVRLLRACATEDLEILSPFPYRVKGIQAVAEQLGLVAASGPGGCLSLSRTGPCDGHHGLYRATFENRDASGGLLSTGLHIAELRDDRLARLIVFVPDSIERM